jgi:hypothetical protein
MISTDCLAYILSDISFKEIPSYICVTQDETVLDVTDKKVMIIGFKKAKNLYADKINTINRKLTENVRWTYSRYEKRDIYEKDLEDFSNEILNDLVEKLPYEYVNLYSNVKLSFIRNFLNNTKKYVYHRKEMLYFLLPDVDKVFGVSIKQLKYAGIGVGKVLKRVDNKINDIITFRTENVVNMDRDLGIKHYLMPFFRKANYL